MYQLRQIKSLTKMHRSSSEALQMKDRALCGIPPIVSSAALYCGCQKAGEQPFRRYCGLHGDVTHVDPPSL